MFSDEQLLALVRVSSIPPQDLLTCVDEEDIQRYLVQSWVDYCNGGVDVPRLDVFIRELCDLARKYIERGYI